MSMIAPVSVRRKAFGRPRLSDDRRRTERLDIRVSPMELSAIRERAEASRRKLARFVRESALGQRVSPVAVADIGTAAELGRLGNNLNQAVRLAHEGRLAVAGLARDDLAGILRRLYELTSELGARLNGAPTEIRQDAEDDLIPWSTDEGRQFKRDLATIVQALNERKQL